MFDSGGSALITNQQLLHPTHHTDPVNRHDELEQIAAALDPLRSNNRPSNLILHGPPGTGKTTCTKHVITQLEDYAVTTEHINCAKHDTRAAVLTQLLPASGFIAGKRGTGPDEKLDKLKQRLNDTSMAVALDEFDRLRQLNDLLYDLYQVGADAEGQIGVVLLSDQPPAEIDLSKRNRSRLNYQPVQFDRYGEQEIRQVLEQRVDDAFRADSVAPAVVDRIAKRVARELEDGQGDMRRAIDLLRMAGQRAQRNGDRKVRVEHVKQVENPARQ